MTAAQCGVTTTTGYRNHGAGDPYIYTDWPAVPEQHLRLSLPPAASNNGITGTWNPATINTAVAGYNVTYTFTPNDRGSVRRTTTYWISVITAQVTPTFDTGPLCQNSILLLSLPAYV